MQEMREEEINSRLKQDEETQMSGPGDMKTTGLWGILGKGVQVGSVDGAGDWDSGLFDASVEMNA